MSQISRQKPPVLPQNSGNFVQKHVPWLYAFWKFSRPHTIIGTTLSVLGVWAIALSNANVPVTPATVALIVPALIACLCGNIYIVGLNQLQDVEIDRINKPHLPLASGEFSRREGWGIVLATGLPALGISQWNGHFLAATVWTSLLIGTAYSLPPIRLKRHPFWASLCIFTVRGAIVNLGLFLHFNQQLGGNAGIPPVIWLLTLFILGFTFAIALFKDIPDLEGDRRYNISTFTLRLGQRTVFNLSRWVLTFCYAAMILAGGFIAGVNSPFLITTHLAALAAFWWVSLRVDLRDKEAIARCYQLIWKLFFLEYILFPFACWFS